MSHGDDVQPPLDHALANASSKNGRATMWCRCGWSCHGQLDACLDELVEHIDRATVIDLSGETRIDLTEPDVDVDMAGPPRHDIAAIDVEPTGYVVTCGCGWRGVAEHRDKVSALWWHHVLAEDALADNDASGS